jgi:hypothetical protein
MALMSAERRLQDVRGVHSHLVIPGTEVELGEETRAVELIQELVHHRNRKLVLGGDRVESAVVDAESPGPIRLADQQHRR